jgi:RecJ-like exonuclease
MYTCPNCGRTTEHSACTSSNISDGLFVTEKKSGVASLTQEQLMEITRKSIEDQRKVMGQEGMTKCQTCGGSGKIQLYWDKPDGTPVGMGEMDCKDCKGHPETEEWESGFWKMTEEKGVGSDVRYSLACRDFISSLLKRERENTHCKSCICPEIYGP